MKKCVVFLILLISIGAKAAEKWTLEKCIQQALTNNLSIKGNLLSEQQANNTLLQSKGTMYPSVNGGGGYSVNFGRSVDPTSYQFVTQSIQSTNWGLSLDMTLFSGLTRWHTIEQNKLEVERNKANTEQSIQDISLSVTEAYLNILLRKEELNINKDQIALTLAQRSFTEILVNNGAAPEGNLLEFEAQLATDSLNYITTENNLRLSLLNLQLLLQIEPTEEFDIVIPSLADDMNKSALYAEAKNVYMTALGMQPSITSGNKGVESAAMGIKIAQGFHYPTISFNASARTSHSSLYQSLQGTTVEETEFTGVIPTTGEDFTLLLNTEVPVFEKPSLFKQYDENFSQALGLNLSIPIFNGLQTRTAVKNARLNLMASQYTLENVKNTLRNDVYQAHAQAQTAYANYTASKKSEAAQMKNLQYIETRYKLGSINNIDYTTARANLAITQLRTLNAKYNYIFRLKVLEFYMGLPISL